MDPTTDYSHLNMGETQEPEPVGSRLETQRALRYLLSQGHRQIDIVSRELDPGIFDRTEVFDQLKSIVLSNRKARIRILVGNMARIIKSGHGIVELSRRLPTFVGLRAPSGEHRKYNGAFVLVDSTAFLQMQLADRYEGAVHCNSPRAAQSLQRLFDDMWETGDINANLRTLSI